MKPSSSSADRKKLTHLMAQFLSHSEGFGSNPADPSLGWNRFFRIAAVSAPCDGWVFGV
jgi:hypothetical protein